MAKQSNQKLKLIYLIQILHEYTDEEHFLTVEDIQNHLKRYDINVERKSVYSDIAELQNYGFDIGVFKENKKNYYHICNREFELAELKLLVDAVQSSKFITVKKSNELIKKLERLASKYDAYKLQRQVYVSGRIKSVNESVYYNVDKIHTAISMNVKIMFQYFNWNADKKRELKKDGNFYTISPFALIWQDENYYMIGYDDENDMIKHYRVDKMLKMSITDIKRKGKSKIKSSDISSYSKKMFSMFNGEETNVTMIFDNNLAGVLIDRFGKDVPIIRIDDNHFRTTVKVAVSGQFFGWIFSLGDGVKIISPDDVVEKMHENLSSIINKYK